MKQPGDFQSCTKRFTAIASALILIVMISSFLNLRPVADDFCFAQSINLGLLNSQIYWYQAWVGDVSITLLNSLLVGLPIAISVKLTFVPLLIGAITVSICVLVLNRESIKSWRGIIGSGFILISWFSYLWFPALTNRLVFGSIGFKNVIAEQSTFWQVVNSSYTVPICILLLIYANFDYLFRKSENINFLQVLLCVGLGFLNGTLGYVLAASAVLWFSYLFFKFQIKTLRQGRFCPSKGFSLWLLGVVSGLLFSVASPGVQNRRIALGSEFDFALIKQLPRSILTSVLTVVELLASPALIIAFLSGITFGFIFRTSNQSHWNIKYLDFLVLIFLLSVLTEISELFSYGAISHLQPIIVVFFICSFSLGIKFSQSRTFIWRKIDFRAISVIWVLIGCLCAAFLQKESKVFLYNWGIGMPFNSLPSKTDKWIASCADDVKTDNSLGNH
jgi:hypothetical protein